MREGWNGKGVACVYSEKREGALQTMALSKPARMEGDAGGTYIDLKYDCIYRSDRSIVRRSHIKRGLLQGCVLCYYNVHVRAWASQFKYVD